MFIRVILAIVIITILITLIKRSKQMRQKKTSTTLTNESMKRCAECGVHVPEDDVQTYQTLHFCCNEHKKTYLQDHQT